jgi:hypothetical protein
MRSTSVGSRLMAGARRAWAAGWGDSNSTSPVSPARGQTTVGRAICGFAERPVSAAARCCPWFTGRLRTQHGPRGSRPVWSRTPPTLRSPRSGTGAAGWTGQGGVSTFVRSRNVVGRSAASLSMEAIAVLSASSRSRRGDSDEHPANTDRMGGHVRHRRVADAQPSAAARAAVAADRGVHHRCAGQRVVDPCPRRGWAPDHLASAGQRHWLVYALVALVFAAGEFAGSYTARSLPAKVWVPLAPDLAWIAAIPLGATLLLLLFPDGRLPSPCWRPVA